MLLSGARLRFESLMALTGLVAAPHVGASARMPSNRKPSPRALDHHLRIVPKLYLLTQRTNYRVFQHLSIPGIVESLLGEARIPHEWRVTRSKYPKLELKVQYGESDYAFISRLLEEAGIAFAFIDRESSGTELVLDDALPSREERPLLPYADNPNQASEREFVTQVRLSHEIRPGAFTLRDFDFRNPGYPLFAEAPKARGPEAAYEQYQYRPGGFLIEQDAGGDTPVADDQGVARYVESYGNQQATRAHGHPRGPAQRHVRQQRVRPLSRLDLSSQSASASRAERGGAAPRDRVAHARVPRWRMASLVSRGLRCRTLRAFGTHRRSRRGRRPNSDGRGPLPAKKFTPTSSAGSVQFLGIARESRPVLSCWVRVSQGWAGTGFGMLVLPRIGQEVLIGFLHGDPDQPVVVGRVFNAIEDVPYKLPDHKTRSTWKSDSSIGHQGFNEIMFEDLEGKELVFMQAEKDLRKLVKHDETITVGNDRQKWVLHNELETTGENRTEVTGVNRTEITEGNRTTIIGEDALKVVQGDELEITEGKMMVVVGGDQDIVVKQDKRERVEGSSHFKVRGKQSQKIDGKYSLSVGADQHVRVTGNLALDASQDIHLIAGSTLVVEATRDLTLKGPGGFIRIDASGVTIRGTRVLINSGGSDGAGAGSSPDAPAEAIEAVIEIPEKPVPENIQVTGVLRPGVSSCSACEKNSSTHRDEALSSIGSRQPCCVLARASGVQPRQEGRSAAQDHRARVAVAQSYGLETSKSSSCS
jgi:type VI secretion system secreted protein VgrG